MLPYLGALAAHGSNSFTALEELRLHCPCGHAAYMHAQQ